MNEAELMMASAQSVRDYTAQHCRVYCQTSLLCENLGIPFSMAEDPCSSRELLWLFCF
jgi:hypothetical protein